MRDIGQSGETSKVRRSIFLSNLLRPRKLWTRLQDSYLQWRDRHAWLMQPFPPAHTRKDPGFAPAARAWTAPQTTHRPRLGTGGTAHNPAVKQATRELVVAFLDEALNRQPRALHAWKQAHAGLVTSVAGSSMP